jgi:hypothetical protein
MCLFSSGERGTMQSRRSFIGVNVSSYPDLRDHCWTSTIRKCRQIHAAPRMGSMMSASVWRIARTREGHLFPTGQAIHQEWLPRGTQDRHRQTPLGLSHPDVSQY